MSQTEILRAFVNQRLSLAAEEIFGLFERTIAEHEEQLCRHKEEHERQRELLRAFYNSQLQLRTAGVQQLLVVKEEVPPEQQIQEDPEPPRIKEEQEDSQPPCIKEEQEDSQPPRIKEEPEEFLISQEGDELQGQEADIIKFIFSPVPVKSEDDEEKPQSSQLHQKQTEQMETEADGEDCGGPGPARNSDPDPHLQPETDESVDSDFRKETRVHPSALAMSGDSSGLKGNLRSHKRMHTGEKPFSCSVCKKSFTLSGELQRHMVIHAGEKPFSCSLCGIRFSQKEYLVLHMQVHTGEKRFYCSLCKQRFKWYNQLKHHSSVCRQSSQLHQTQTEENREAEPPASSSTQQIQTADGEDCGGPEPARNSDPDPHLQPDPENKSGDSSEPETDDSADWKETREPQSGLNSLKNEEVPVSDSRCGAAKKPFSCSECGKRFVYESILNRHMRTHTMEKPYNCSVCPKTFSEIGNLNVHMRSHTGAKPFSCSSCDKRFLHKHHLKIHMRTHLSEKPFPCSVCGKTFACKASLRQHMSLHTGEKKFRCRVCEERFRWYAQLKKHKCAGRQLSQRHQTQTEENREAEPPASSSTQHIKTEADGKDCGGPEPARNSVPDTHVHPDSDDKTGDSSEPETDDSEDDWMKTRKPQPGLKSLKNEEVPVSDSRCSAAEKPFSCSLCAKRFPQMDHLKQHMNTHAGQYPFSCSVCDQRFHFYYQLKNHQAVRCRTSQLRQSQTEENREAEPPASSSTRHIKTEADGKDCGGPEPARSSGPDTHLKPEDKTGDSSEPETEDSDDD